MKFTTLLSLLLISSSLLLKVRAFTTALRGMKIPKKISCDCIAYLKQADKCGWLITDEEIDTCAEDPTTNLTSDAFANFQYWCKDLNLHHKKLRLGEKKNQFTRQLTCHSNLDKETRRSHLCGVYKEPNPVPRPVKAVGVGATAGSCQYATTSILPTSVDWRNITTATRDQGNCGCCWAMTATEMCEAYQRQVKNTKPKLSVQNLMSCDKSNYGCDGGFVDLAGNYINKTGLVTDAIYPFKSGSTGTNGRCSSYSSTKYKCPKTITESYEYSDRKGNCNRLKMLLQYGPVGIYMLADDEGFYQYKSGVFSSNILDGTTDTTVDHAVLAVGYTTINGVDAFIVQNSWGASWGENGFFYIAAAGNQMNICQNFFYYNVRNLSC